MSRSQSVPRTTRLVVLERDGWRCVRCDVSVITSPYSLHHRKARGMGGTRDPRSSDPRNLLTLCGTGTTGCHGWVESHRAAALHDGWLLPNLDELDRPVLTILGTRILLAPDGGREDVWPADDLTPSEVSSHG